jgi:hypothetical protein
MASQTSDQMTTRFQAEELASIIIKINCKNRDRGKSHVDAIFEQLRRASLHVQAWLSIKEMTGHQDIFLRVYASEFRLLAEAERTRFVLRLNSSALRQADIDTNRAAASTGVVFSVAGGDQTTLSDDDLAIPESTGRCAGRYDPYSFCYAPYVTKPQLAHLYSINKGTGSVLSQTAALKLLINIVEAPVAEGGANLDLDGLVVRQVAAAWFPMGDRTLVSVICSQSALSLALLYHAEPVLYCLFSARTL